MMWGIAAICACVRASVSVAWRWIGKIVVNQPTVRDKSAAFCPVNSPQRRFLSIKSVPRS